MSEQLLNLNNLFIITYNNNLQMPLILEIFWKKNVKILEILEMLEMLEMLEIVFIVPFIGKIIIIKHQQEIDNNTFCICFSTIFWSVSSPHLTLISYTIPSSSTSFINTISITWQFIIVIILILGEIFLRHQKK